MATNKLLCTNKDIRWFTYLLAPSIIKHSEVDLHVQEHLTPALYQRIFLKAAELCGLNTPHADHLPTATLLSWHVRTIFPYKRVRVIKPLKQNFDKLYDYILLPLFKKEDRAIVSQPIRGKSFHLTVLDYLYRSRMDQVCQEAFVAFTADILYYTLPTLFDQSKKRKRKPRHLVASLKKPSLIELLVKIEDNNEALTILRVADHVQSPPSCKDLTLILSLLHYNATVQVLHLNNLGTAFTDQTMEELIRLLAMNHMIWAVDIGGNALVSQRMWRKVVNELPRTGITHIHAGSEASICETLKWRMLNAVRGNWYKHRLHCDPSNAAVINNVNEMWKNPEVKEDVRTA